MVGATRWRAGLAFAVIAAIGLTPSALAAHTSPTDAARPAVAQTAYSSNTHATPSRRLSRSIALTADVPHGLPAKAIGVPNPSSPMHVGILLAGRDEAGLTQFLHDVVTPGTASYRQPLTPWQFAARFGVEPKRDAAVRGWLLSGGVDLPAGQPVGSRYLLARGTVGSVSRLLGVRFATYGGSSEAPFVANLNPPTVPRDLGITRVVGLNGSLRMQPLLRRGLPLSETTNPADLWQLYDQPTSNLGQGQQLATLLWGSRAELEPAMFNDLAAFESLNKLPTVKLHTAYENGADYVDPGPSSDTLGAGLIEAELDTQASTAMAPAASTITAYFAETPGIVDLAKSAMEWATDAAASPQLSASFGGCETFDLALEGSALDSAFQTAMAEGRTVFTGSGDSGAGCSVGASTGANSPILDVEFPASSPYVVAVGGTVVTEDGHTSPTSEYAWNTGGGGISKYESEPSWQVGVAPLPARCAVDEKTITWSGNTDQANWLVTSDDPNNLPTDAPSPPPSPMPAEPCRGVPDVAAQSGDIPSGFNIVTSGAEAAEVGTSVSAPLWQGMWARIAAAYASAATVPKGHHGKRPQPTPASVGFAAPALYASPAAFNDIILGDNGPYPATPGWDYTTGLGSPDVGKLITAIDGPGAIPTISAPVLAPDAGTADGPLTPGGVGSGVPTCASGPDQVTGHSGQATQIAGQDTVIGPSQQDLDILGGKLSWSGGTLTAVIQVENLNAMPPDGANTQENYVYSFQVNNFGAVFTFDAERQLSPSALGRSVETFAVKTGGPGPTGSSTSVNGTFDPGSNTITVSANQTALTAVGAPTLGPGDFLTNMSVAAQRDVGVAGHAVESTADSANATCDYRLP